MLFLRNHKRQLGADTLLLLTAFFWGVTFAVVKEAIRHVDPFVFLTQRFALACALLAPCCWLRRRAYSRAALTQGVILGVFLFGAFALQTVGLQYTTASNAGFLTGLNVVLVPLLGAVLHKDSVSLNARVGVVLAAAGLFLLSTDGSWMLRRGDVLVVLCAVCIAFQILCTGRYAKTCDVAWLTTIQLATVGVLSLFCAACRGESPLFWEPRILTAVVVCAVFATVFAFLVQTSMQRFTSPTHTALIFCMEPVFGAVYARWALNEMLGSWGLLGAGLIFLGMVISELPAPAFRFVVPQVVRFRGRGVRSVKR